MNREAPPYAGLLAEIRAGLTGDPQLDVPFLNSQARRYREEPWADPFLREIGRLVFDLLPAEAREVRQPVAEGPEAGPTWSYLRSLQQDLLGPVSCASLEEGRAALAREMDEAEASGKAPFWASEAANLTEEDWDQSLLFGQPILAEMAARLVRAAQGMDLPVGPARAWGVLPVAAPLGRVLVAPTGERVPVVSSGWLLFAHLMAKVTASCLPVRSHEGEEGLSFEQDLVEAHVRAEGTLHRRFVELMQAAARGDAGLAPTWVLGEPAGQIGSLFCESAELFLMAEQLAVAGVAAVQEERFGSLSVSRLAPSREEQIRAAVVALQLAAAVQAERGLDFPLCATGIVTCLFGAALAEGLSHPATPEREGLLSAGYRLQILLEVLRKKAPQALELAEVLMQALGTLWKAHEHELRAEGRRPAQSDKKGAGSRGVGG